jgi:hypothetical protein
MLRTLVFNDMTFGVFPFMEMGFTYSWYYNIGEVFDAVWQVLQVCDEQSVFNVLC